VYTCTYACTHTQNVHAQTDRHTHTHKRARESSGSPGRARADLHRGRVRVRQFRAPQRRLQTVYGRLLWPHGFFPPRKSVRGSASLGRFTTAALFCYFDVDIKRALFCCLDVCIKSVRGSASLGRIYTSEEQNRALFVI
jgi:hypothetical protein